MIVLCRRAFPILIFLVLAVPAALVFLFLGTDASDDPLPKADYVRPVLVNEAIAKPELVRLRLPGVTRASKQGSLSFIHAGHLAERRVRQGQLVEKGEVLAILHNPSLIPSVEGARAKVREIEEELSQIEKDAARLQHLHRQDLVSTSEMERVVSRRNALREGRAQAEARLNETRAQMAEASIRAPYKGTVVDLYVEPGQVVLAGQPILSIIGASAIEVELHLPSHRAAALTVGEFVLLRQIETGITASSKIQEISPASAGRPAAIILVVNSEAPEEWYPGQSVHAEFTWHGPTQIMVPLSAVIDPGTGKNHVFRIDEGIAKQVQIKTGKLINNHITISGSIKSGDLIVVAGHSQLLDGEPIKVVP